MGLGRSRMGTGKSVQFMDSGVIKVYILLSLEAAGHKNTPPPLPPWGECRAWGLVPLHPGLRLGQEPRQEMTGGGVFFVQACRTSNPAAPGVEEGQIGANLVFIFSLDFFCRNII